MKTVLCTIFSLSKQGTCMLQLIDKFREKHRVLKKWRLRKHCIKKEWILNKLIWFYSDMKFEKAVMSLFHFDVYYGFWLELFICILKILYDNGSFMLMISNVIPGFRGLFPIRQIFCQITILTLKVLATSCQDNGW